MGKRVISIENGLYQFKRVTVYGKGNEHWDHCRLWHIEHGWLIHRTGAYLDKVVLEMHRPLYDPYPMRTLLGL